MSSRNTDQSCEPGPNTRQTLQPSRKSLKLDHDIPHSICYSRLRRFIYHPGSGQRAHCLIRRIRRVITVLPNIRLGAFYELNENQARAD